MKKYEHQVMPVTYNGDIQGLAQDDSILNGLGKEGWVLVSAVPVVRNGNTVQILYCLMRPIP
jgi:hypothetical protein